jgi:hypothetical protein
MIKAPYLPAEKLRFVAQQFLADYNPGGMIPVPIESIVEKDFGIDIVPTPGLEKAFNIDTYPTNDLTEFHVDEYVYKRQPRRYRFSLAHEIAHVLIHKDVFANLQFSSIAEWKEVVCSIPEDQYSWIEWQAYTLGGLILVPEGPLRGHFERSRAAAEAAGVACDDLSEESRRIIESHIATAFDVSRDVITRRIKLDKLW